MGLLSPVCLLGTLYRPAPAWSGAALPRNLSGPQSRGLPAPPIPSDHVRGWIIKYADFLLSPAHGYCSPLKCHLLPVCYTFLQTHHLQVAFPDN